MLSEVLASDPDRVARFEQEARVLASLNHTNIATVFGLEHLGSRAFLVMELIEGETLAERIARFDGGLPWREALSIARPCLEAAVRALCCRRRAEHRV